MYKYKIDVIKELSKKGFTTSRIRKEKLLSESTLTKLRNEKNVTLESLSVVCTMLHCQLTDIIEIYASPEEKLKYF